MNRFWNTCVKLQSMQYSKVNSVSHFINPTSWNGLFFGCQLLVQVNLSVVPSFSTCKESKSNRTSKQGNSKMCSGLLLLLSAGSVQDDYCIATK